MITGVSIYLGSGETWIVKLQPSGVTKRFMDKASAEAYAHPLMEALELACGGTSK